MRKHLTAIAVSLLTTIYSCSPGGGTTTPATPTPTVNSTETQLTSTWYLSSVKVTGMLDTTYTGYDNSCYIQFTTNAFPGAGVPANYKLAQQAFGAVPGPSFPSASPVYWYYDPSVTKLVISPGQYSITTLSATQLTIITSSSAQSNTYSFHK